MEKKLVELVCEGSVINGAYPVYFSQWRHVYLFSFGTEIKLIEDKKNPTHGQHSAQTKDTIYVFFYQKFYKHDKSKI